MTGTGAQETWDDDYRKKGRLYGGSPRALPVFSEGARVLELGCGDGKTLSALVSPGRDVTAVDFSPHAVSLARTAVRPGSGAGLAVADARALPFRDAVFDVVVAVHVLGHSTKEDRARMAGEAGRMVRPGGLLYVADFSRGDFRCGSGQETEPGSFVRGNGVLTHYFTGPEVIALFPGFVVESLDEVEWMLRVRGRDYRRSETVALFRKCVPRTACMDPF
jgi:SAM-dependent methyltransferase